MEIMCFFVNYRLFFPPAKSEFWKNRFAIFFVRAGGSLKEATNSRKFQLWHQFSKGVFSRITTPEVSYR